METRVGGLELGVAEHLSDVADVPSAVEHKTPAQRTTPAEGPRVKTLRLACSGFLAVQQTHGDGHLTKRRFAAHLSNRPVVITGSSPALIRQ
jgi:hypothetical protein